MTSLSALYSRIQFVPDLDRDEVINLGVALYCRDADYFDALYLAEDDRTTVSRLKRFAPNADVLEINKSLNAIRNYLESVSKMGTDELKYACQQMGPKIVLKELQPILSHDPAKDLERLYKQLIVAPSQNRVVKPYVSTTLKSLFIERRLIGHYEPRTLEVHRFPVKLDLVEKEHTSTVFKAFRLQRDASSFDTASKWNYTFKALRDRPEYQESKFFAVCEMDGSDNAKEAAHILSENTGVIVVDVREEQKILQYAQVGG